MDDLGQRLGRRYDLCSDSHWESSGEFSLAVMVGFRTQVGFHTNLLIRYYVHSYSLVMLMSHCS